MAIDTRNKVASELEQRHKQCTHNSKQQLEQFTEAQVSKHNKEGDAWVIVNSFVYNVTDFIDEHPGGAQLVVANLGKDITSLMSNAKVHRHSPSAFSMLDGYKIGVLKAEGKSQAQQIHSDTPVGWGKVNFNKPVVHQVGLLGGDYFRWVSEEPVHFKDCIHLFANDWMEMVTHTKWYVPLLFWVPVSMLLFYISLYKLSNFAHGIGALSSSLAAAVALWIVGFVAWFFVEYSVHKYVFHWDWLGTRGYYVTNIMHFLLHGMHHKVPMDRDRLVAPLLLAGVITSAIVSVLKVIGFSNYLVTGIVSGALIGYLCYDMTHYSVHHAANPKELPTPMSWLVKTNYFQELRKHHLIHHFSTTGHLNNFGISNRIVDTAFGTLQTEHN